MQIESLTEAADEAKAKLSETEERVADLTEQLKSADEAKVKLSDERVAHLTEQLKSASAQVEQLAAQRDAAQSKLSEQTVQIQTIFAKAKEFTEQANARDCDRRSRTEQATIIIRSGQCRNCASQGRASANSKQHGLGATSE